MNTAEESCIVAQQMSMFTVQKLKILDFTDPSIILRLTEHNHIPDEEGMSRKRTKHVLCDAASNRLLDVPLSQVSAWYNNYIVLFNRYMHTYCVHALMTYYNATWLNEDSHAERACRHDQDEQRCRGMAQQAEQSHRLLPSERLQTGDGSEGGAGAYRAHTPTRRHWCAATTTTTKIPEPRHTTGPTTGPVPIGPADDYLTELRHVVHHYWTDNVVQHYHGRQETHFVRYGQDVGTLGTLFHICRL